MRETLNGFTLKIEDFKRGFTLIELLVVFSVMGILSAIGIAAFVDYNRQQTIVQAASLLKNNLRLAQSKALSQEVPSGCINLSAYQLRFADDGRSYTVRPICQGIEGALITAVTFPSTVRKIEGLSSIRFKILIGATDNPGFITLTDSGRTSRLEVTSVGVIK